MKFRVLPLTFLTLSLAACQVTKNMDEMKDATAQIRDTSKELKETSGDLYDDLRQGDAKASRETSLRDMLNARSLQEKIKHAAHYYMAFEYQLWTGAGKDDSARRELLQAEAAREFVRTLQSFAEAGQSTPRPFASRSPFQGGSPSKAEDAENRQQCLNTLAAAMHLLNPKQEFRIKLNPSMKPVSMMTMVEDAMRARYEISLGQKAIEQYPKHVHELLAFSWVVDLALQARYNFLGFSAIYTASDLQREFTEVSFFDLKTWSFHTISFNVLRKLAFGWSPLHESMNDSEIRVVTEYLTWGMETRKLMEETGLEPKLNPRVHQLLNKMQLTPEQEIRMAQAASLPPSARRAREAAMIKLFRAYSGVNKETPNELPGQVESQEDIFSIPMAP